MDEASFKEKVLPLSQRIFPYALQLLKDIQEAEDVVQEIWVRLWEMRAKIHEIRNLEAFTYRMTRNYCLDRLKKSKPEYVDDRTTRLEYETETDRVQDPQRILETRDAMEKVMRIVGNMPEQQQTLLHLREVEGLDYAEIAEITGLEINAIRVSLSRARKKIREMMEQLYQR